MVDSIRTSFLYHVVASLPLLTFALAFLATQLTQVWRLRLPWKSLALALLAVLVASAVWYLFLPILFDDAEAGLAGASVLAMRGLQIYPDPSGAAHYGLVYGPWASLWHIPFYYVFGPGLFSFKLGGVLAFLFTLFGMYRICRKYAAPVQSLLGVAFGSIVLFQYLGYDFFGRSDPLILALSTACILVTIDGPAWLVMAVGAATLGMLPNLKISAVAYALPLLGYIIIRRGWRIATIVSGCALVVVALPFALPQVSLANFVFLLNTVQNHKIVPELVSRNIQYCLVMLSPFAFLGRGSSWPSAQRWYLGLIACGMAFTCYVGGKGGAGSYHLMPYVIPLLHLYFWRRSELRPETRGLMASRILIPIAATLFFYSTTRIVIVKDTFLFAPIGKMAVADIRETEKAYAGLRIEVGAGETWNDPLQSYGTVAAFDGQPYTLNDQSIWDSQTGGVQLAASTTRYMRDCGTQVWLIPKGESPFSQTNGGDNDRPAFGKEFQDAFLGTYRRVAALRVYDVWACASAPDNTR